MTLMPLLFWALLLVPGFAVARRWMPDELEGGLLPGMAVSWVTALAVLAPFAVVGYLVGVSIWVAVAVVVAFVLWGGYEIGRSGAWRGIGRLLLGALTIELVLIGVEFVFSVRIGSILAADARVHLARIRFLYDHGLTNVDPFVQSGYLYPIYHTNIHHALFATGSRLMGVDPVTFWFGSLAMVKMMIASGAAYLAWAVLGGRWAAWIAAIMVLVNRGPVTFSVYPNQMAPWFLLPVLLGVVTRTLATAWREPDEAWWRRLPRLAGAAMVIGMVHPLYAGFAVVVCSPILLGVAAWRAGWRLSAIATGAFVALGVLAVVAIAGFGAKIVPTILVMLAGFGTVVALGVWRIRGSRPGVASAAFGWVLVVTFAMPFPLAGKLMTVKDRDAAVTVADVRERISGGRAGVEVDDRVVGDADLEDEPESRDASVDFAPTATQRVDRLLKAKDGWINYQFGDTTWLAREPGRGFTGSFQRSIIKAWRVIVVVTGAVLAVVLLRRREAWYVLAAIGVVQAVVFIPPVATTALRFLGAQWMLERFETLAFVFFIPLSVPVLAAIVERALRPRLAQVRMGEPLGRLVLAAITALAVLVGIYHATHRRPYDWDYYWNRVSAPLRYRHGREYLQLMKLQRFLEENIPAGTTVVTGEFTGTRLKMLHDLKLVASERSSTGVADGGRRRIDLKLMFSLATEEEDRADLFDEYGVTHIVTRGSPRVWMDWWDVDTTRRHGYAITELAAEPDLTDLWRRNLKLGVRHLQAGRFDRAVEKLREVVLEDPKLEKAWFHLGRVYDRKGDAVLAAESYERASEIDPTDLRYPLMHGNAASSAERYPEALDAFDRAKRLAMEQEDEGQAATASLNLGNTWYMLGQLEAAIEAYDEAIELDDNYEKARVYRDAVSEILLEEQEASRSAAEPGGPSDDPTDDPAGDQSADDAGAPARPEENTPSASPTP